MIGKIESFAQENGFSNKTDKEGFSVMTNVLTMPGLKKLPRIIPLVKEMNEVDMPRLYKNFDCFVLPTRGLFYLLVRSHE